jgi:hypothetical protein
MSVPTMPDASVRSAWSVFFDWSKTRAMALRDVLFDQAARWSLVPRLRQGRDLATSFIPFWPDSKPVAIVAGLLVCAWILTLLAVPALVIVTVPVAAIRFGRDCRSVATWFPFTFSGYVLILWVLAGFDAANPMAWAALSETWFANRPISLWIPIATSLALATWLVPTRSAAAFIKDRYPRAKLRTFYISTGVCVALILGIDAVLGLTSIKDRSLWALGILFAMSLVSRLTTYIKSETRKQAVAEVVATSEATATARVASVSQAPTARVPAPGEACEIPDMPLRIREGALAVFDLDEVETDQVAIPGSMVEGKNGLSPDSIAALSKGQQVGPGETDRFSILRRLMDRASSTARVRIPIRPDAPVSDVPASDAPTPVPVSRPAAPGRSPDVPESAAVSGQAGVATRFDPPTPLARVPAASAPATVVPSPGSARADVLPRPGAGFPLAAPTPYVPPPPVPAATVPSATDIEPGPFEQPFRPGSILPVAADDEPLDESPAMRRTEPLADPDDDLSASEIMDVVDPVLLDEPAGDDPVVDGYGAAAAGQRAPWLDASEEPFYENSPSDTVSEPVVAVLPEVLHLDIGDSEPMAMEPLEDDPFGSPAVVGPVVAADAFGPAPISEAPLSGPAIPDRSLAGAHGSAVAATTGSHEAVPPAGAADRSSDVVPVTPVVPSVESDLRRVRGVAIRMIGAYTKMLSKGVDLAEIDTQVLSKITDRHVEVMRGLPGGDALISAYDRFRQASTGPAVTASAAEPDEAPAFAVEVPVVTVEPQDTPKASTSPAIAPAASSDSVEPSSGAAAVVAPTAVLAVPAADASASDATASPAVVDPADGALTERATAPDPAPEVVETALDTNPIPDQQDPITIAEIMASRDTVPSITPADRAAPPRTDDLPSFDMSSVVIAPRLGEPSLESVTVTGPLAPEAESAADMPSDHREALEFIEMWMAVPGSSVAELDGFFAHEKRPFPDDMELGFLARRLSEFEPSQLSARRLEASLSDVVGRPSSQLLDLHSLNVIKGLYAAIPSEVFDRWRFKSRDQMMARLGLFFKVDLTLWLTSKLELWLHDGITTADDVALAKSYVPAVEVLLKAYVEREDDLSQLRSAIDLAEFNLAQASVTAPSLVHEGIESAISGDGSQSRSYARSRLVSATLPAAIQDAISQFLRLAAAIDTIDMTVKRESLKNKSTIESHPLYGSLTELEHRAVDIIEDIKINLVKREQMLKVLPEVIGGRNEDAGVLYERLSGSAASITEAVAVQRDRQKRAAASLEQIAKLETDLARQNEEIDHLRVQMKDRIVSDTVTALARALSEREPALMIVDRKGPVKLRSEIGTDIDVAVVIIHGGDQKWTVMSGTKLETAGVRGAKVHSIDLVALREWVRNSHPFGIRQNLRLRIVIDSGDLSGSHCDYVFSRRDIAENPAKLLEESDFDVMA